MRSTRPPELRIGCSGWQYAAWKGAFYPASLPQREWLAYYAAHFDTVEVNGTFYQLPKAGTFASWRAETPSGFRMAVKASRFLTHMTRLREPSPPLRRLVSRAAALGTRLGPLLYQLPASLPYDRPRLVRFLKALDRLRTAVWRRTLAPRLALRHVVEFRHPSWYRDDVFELLASHGVAGCVHDRHGSVAPRRAVGPFVYVRFHGASGAYRGGYGRRRLASWAEWIAGERERGVSVYAYFNNDPGAAAVRDAETLRRLL